MYAADNSDLEAMRADSEEETHVVYTPTGANAIMRDRVSCGGTIEDTPSRVLVKSE